MPDREKVMKGLEICAEKGSWHGLDCSMTKAYKDCPYYLCETGCVVTIARDALALLKEQDEIVRCKDCKHRPKEPNFKTYENGFDIEFPEGSKCPCRCSDDEYYSWYPEDDWFCADGERRDTDA